MVFVESSKTEQLEIGIVSNICGAGLNNIQ